ncbi:hypothetical protein ACH4RA_11525 [Streptomyces smyrnaeus]|uniref:hypothetical protein n=1 Tax=Streptomyces TaxID=1883 RepID=UPI000C54AAA2|nr:hypothetical protein [Streptomyces sp. RK75]MBQ0867436.1 hypothetical protein [Streptomyces sp. RK75]MBQ1162323.1 hypothetical protein [Streptomyces sp. A73]
MNVQEQARTATPKSLVLGVEELVVVQDRYDSLRSDNQGSSGDAPWPGGDGNLSDH